MSIEIDQVGTDHDAALKVEVEDTRYYLTAFYDLNDAGQYEYQGYRCPSRVSPALKQLLIWQTVEKLRMKCESVVFEKDFGNDKNLSIGSRELVAFIKEKDAEGGA